MKTTRNVSLFVLLSALAFGATTAFAATPVSNLQPSWDAVGGGGVFSAYIGPPDYGYVSPGSTALFDSREAGIIKAGITASSTGSYDDEGLFGFRPTVTIDGFASSTLTYDVQNQYGENPVWMTIEIDTGVVDDRSDNTTYQFVPTTNPAGWNTFNAGAGMWQKWNDNNGDTTGNPLISLGDVATAHTGLNVVRTYLRLGMGNSYHGIALLGTVAWVDQATLGGVTYDFVVASATTPSLGVAATYGILSSTYINTSAATRIDGDVGFTSEPAVIPLGTHLNYGSGAPYSTAGTDAATALFDLNNQVCTFTFAPGAIVLGSNLEHPSVTYLPGVYCIDGAVSTGATITLSGAGTHIFRSTGALNAEGSSIVTLDGASADDIFWTPNGATTLNANATFIGTVLSTSQPITTLGNVSWTGRALTFGGVVTTGDTDTISVPTISPTTGPVWEEEGTQNGVLDPGEYFFQTIQSAIDAGTTVSGDTIYVSAGTYTTTGQVLIDKNLSIVGDATNKPTINPAADLTANNNAASAWFLVNAGVTFNLTNVVLNGNGKKVQQAVRSHGTTSISNVDFANIVNSTSPYVGFAIANFGGTIPGGAGSDTHISGGSASALTVTNSTFTNIGRIGVLVKGTESTATITGNTYTGKGDGNFLDYAFEFGAGGSGTMSGNTISGNRGVASSDGSTSAGILVTDYYGTGTSATIENNTITNNTDGVAVGYDITDASTVTIHNSNLSGNTIGVNSTNPSVDAIQNWWGNASGPTHTSNAEGTGDAISDAVTFAPWYINTEMTVLSDSTVTNATYTSTTEGQADLPNGATEVTLTDTTVMDLSNATTSMTSTPVTVGGETVTLTQSVTLQSGVNTEPIVLTNSNLANVSASIPDGTIIQGPAEWDGTIMPPTDAPSDGTAPAGFSVGNTVISVGSPDVTLVFDQAVTLLLAGVTGAVGYKPAGSNTWVQITNVCADPYLTPGNPPANSECAISNGTDTKIVTYHFTTFGGLDPIPAPAPAPAVSGGGIVGGDFSFLNIVKPRLQTIYPDGKVVFLDVPAVPTVSPAIPAQGRGEVLGESAFRFNNYLVIGSRGDDVTELQNRLTAEGVYSGPITGYFGSLTSQGVKNFQKKYGISQVGVVGPQTRAKLNSGVAVGTGSGNEIPGCAVGNKFNTTTGLSCPVQASSGQGCAVGNKFSTTTGLSCPVQ